MGTPKKVPIILGNPSIEPWVEAVKARTTEAFYAGPKKLWEAQRHLGAGRFLGFRV